MQIGVSAARRCAMLGASLIVASAIAACGTSATSGSDGNSGSGSAQALLRQTFTGSHKVSSGVLRLDVTITPNGSSELKTPLKVSFGGPFQSRGQGRLPESDFTVALGGLSQKESFGVISTGTTGYLSIQGASYRLPQSEFKQLEKTISSTSGSGAPQLSQLGIDPLKWLSNPSVVGTEAVDGAQTTEIRAGVNVGALLSGLRSLLSKESGNPALKSAHVPTSISPAEQRQIAAAVKHPVIDLWTGRTDTTLRRLTLALQIALAGKTSKELGGLTSAEVRLQLDYTDLNQPQKISAPADALPYSQLENKLAGLGSQLGGLSGSSSSPSAGSRKYLQCVSKARTDLSKLQKCASLIDAAPD